MIWQWSVLVLLGAHLHPLPLSSILLFCSQWGRNLLRFRSRENTRVFLGEFLNPSGVWIVAGDQLGSWKTGCLSWKMSCLERESANPHYCLRMLETVHRMWHSSSPEVQPISFTCIIQLTALCLNDWWSTVSWMIMGCYCAKAAFSRSALSDWCAQPCGVQREEQQTPPLPRCRQRRHVSEKWCTGGQNPSLQMLMKEHRRQQRENRMSCAGILWPTFILTL